MKDQPHPDMLEATRLTVDAMREETVPLLREIKGSVERTNGHLDRVGHVLDSVGGIVGRVERLTGLIEHVAASPIMKFISVGAGVKKAAESFGKKKHKNRSDEKGGKKNKKMAKIPGQQTKN